MLEAVGSRRRGSSAWSEHFSRPQPLRHTTENEVPQAAPDQTDTEAFLHSFADVLTPPCFNWYTLEVFLNSAKSPPGVLPTKPSELPKLCFLEDRSQNSVRSHICTNGDERMSGIESITRQQSTERMDDLISPQALNEEELSHYLGQNVSSPSSTFDPKSDKLPAVQA